MQSERMLSRGLEIDIDAEANELKCLPETNLTWYLGGVLTGVAIAVNKFSNMLRKLQMRRFSLGMLFDTRPLQAICGHFLCIPINWSKLIKSNSTAFLNVTLFHRDRGRERVKCSTDTCFHVSSGKQPSVATFLQHSMYCISQRQINGNFSCGVHSIHVSKRELRKSFAIHRVPRSPELHSR